MKEAVGKICLIFLCLYSLFFFAGGILAPITAYFHNYNLSAHLTSLYMYSCHQQLDRSFWIFGYPAALCSRCCGVYLGVFISCLLAIFDRFKLAFRYAVAILVFAVCDIVINYALAGYFNTGNILRFIAGVLLGVLIVKMFSCLFKIQKEE